MPRRTTMIFDLETEAMLAALAEEAGSKTLAVKAALASAHRSMQERIAREELIDWLIQQGGEPTAEDDAWATSVAAELAVTRDRVR